MDGIRNIAGKRTRTIEIGGKSYTISPMTLSNYAERESYILALKPHPLSVIESAPKPPNAPAIPVPPNAGCSPAEREKYGRDYAAYVVIKEAYDSAMQLRQQFFSMMRDEALKPRVVSMAEDAAFDQSLHGIGYRFWRSLKDHHPEVDSVQSALDLLELAGSSRLGEIRSTLDDSEEKDILKNSEAPAAGHQVTAVPLGG